MCWDSREMEKTDAGKHSSIAQQRNGESRSWVFEGGDPLECLND